MRIIKKSKELKDIFSSKEEVRNVLASELRGSALKIVYNLFQAEMNELCGGLFQRKSDCGLCHRGGTNPGSVLLRGQRIEVTKPRARKNGKEVELNSYEALQSYDLLQPKVMDHMLYGVSTRNYDRLLEEVSNGVGLSKSSVSRVFVKGSQKSLDEINFRDLSASNFIAIMIDGIEFAERNVIVALGITETMKKVILGLRIGDTENSEVCKDLLSSVIERGLSTDSNYLFVLDGSKALRKAVNKVFGDDSLVQRCVRHKERNIISYLPKQFHMEFRRRWKKIHGLINYEIAKNELDKLYLWLKGISLEAANSLEEAEGETLTVIRLEADKNLRRTLSSTNPIESLFSQVRIQTQRVKRWRLNTNQPIRWVAAKLLEIEGGLCRQSYKSEEIIKFKNNLTKEKALKITKKVA